MRTFDLSPLYRMSVGFDRLNRLFDSVARWDETAGSYPPYDIARTGDDAYRITMAVAGFEAEELDVSLTDGTLRITGHKAEPKGENEPRYLYRGIAARSFEHRFELAESIVVKGASLANGLLSVDLVREVPEALKPRWIPIAVQSPEETGEGGAGKRVGHKAAA